MNRRLIWLATIIFGAIGAFIPVVLGVDKSGLDGWSILGGFVGGLFGVWLAVWAFKRFVG